MLENKNQQVEPSLKYFFIYALLVVTFYIFKTIKCFQMGNIFIPYRKLKGRIKKKVREHSELILLSVKV
jgi:hypothetical protein